MRSEFKLDDKAGYSDDRRRTGIVTDFDEDDRILSIHVTTADGRTARCPEYCLDLISRKQTRDSIKK